MSLSALLGHASSVHSVVCRQPQVRFISFRVPAVTEGGRFQRHDLGLPSRKFLADANKKVTVPTPIRIRWHTNLIYSGLNLQIKPKFRQIKPKFVQTKPKFAQIKP
ncbi:MAG: hypothetical protein J6M53_04290 [Bacteroidaceae bacterium]|nr:hypothetical protein [Bacteroidaceae bacterium]